MSMQLNWITKGVLVLGAFGLIGCGQGFQVAGSGGNASAKAVSIDTEMAKAEQASQSAQVAIAEADEVLTEIMDDKGNINVGLFKSSGSAKVQSQYLLSGLTTKLREVFDNVFARAVMVKAKFAEARAALAAALAKLDQTIPAQAAMATEIMTKIKQIEALELQFSSKMHMLAGKLDLAINGLDKLISGATSFIPGWGWVIDLALDFFVMDDIKALILEIKMKLLSL